MVLGGKEYDYEWEVFNEVSTLTLSRSLRSWVNDFNMQVFYLVLRMNIKFYPLTNIFISFYVNCVV